MISFFFFDFGEGIGILEFYYKFWKFINYFFRDCRMLLIYGVYYCFIYGYVFLYVKYWVIKSGKIL